MKKKFLKLAGIGILTLALAANVQYAFNGYGLGANNFGFAAAARDFTNTGSGGSDDSNSNSSNSSAGVLTDEKVVDCVLPVGGGSSSSTGGSVTIVDGIPVGSVSNSTSTTNPNGYIKGKKTACEWAWAVCTSVECIPNK
ncbi:hypothetical protein SAMN04488511_11333 [Pedobacter suwonensis]|uniref:Uncharacterized protein n=1 Tax=Pedobacter suwonensis TaxID=332999 RepID=A0A1I0TQZ8_9SPHI|nr:hypothetical protein [Pedobacter suwonensis]SFA54142.1 hypothetical protein SAMN04488511_11333 [Pedobacter suwonensis]